MRNTNKCKQEFWAKYFCVKMLDFEPTCPIDAPELQEEAIYDFKDSHNQDSDYECKNIY